MSVCYVELSSGKLFKGLITYAEYQALPASDRSRYALAYPNMIKEEATFSLKHYGGLDYYGEDCGARTQGSAALPPSSVVDAAFRAEVRARARAPLAASRRAASGPTAADGRGRV